MNAIAAIETWIVDPSESRRVMNLNCSYHANGSDITLNCPDAVRGSGSSWLDLVSDWPAGRILALILGIVIAFFFLRATMRICSQWDRAVILRLGKFHRVAGPGLFLKMPIIDQIAEWVSLQTEVTNVVADKSLTKDTVPVTVSAVIYWRVAEPDKAVIAVDDYTDSVTTTAQIALREAIGSHTFSDLLSNRESVDVVIAAAIEKKVKAWGVVVDSVDIKDVVIPDALQNAMSQEAQAEREAHARAILGTSEKSIASNFVEAAKVYADNPMALELRKMNIIYEMREGGNMVLLPTGLLDALTGIMGKKP